MPKSQGVSQAKDDVEEQLEHLVFGDDAGFYESLRQGSPELESLHRGIGSSSVEGPVVEDEDLEDADDSRVGHRC